MTLSVLMSVWRGEEAGYLDTAIRSVWTEQTRLPDQLVLVEDGALGDGLLCIIGRWKAELDDKMIIVKNVRNLGLAKSLNKGIAVCTGDLIARMDSDDVADKRRMERQADFLNIHSDIDIVGGAIIEFSDKEPFVLQRNYPQTTEEVMRYISKASPLAHPAVMMRRRIFDSGLRYDEKYLMSQDIALWFDVLAKGYRIANIPEVVLRYRRTKTMFKRRGRKKAVNELKIYIKGIYRLNGLLTYKYIYPLLRFVFRLMPCKLIEAIYNNKVRRMLLEPRNFGSFWGNQLEQVVS